MKKNNAEMRALAQLREVIDAMMSEDFESRRKPALMALKVSKTEMPLEEVLSEEKPEGTPEGMHKMPDGEIMPDSEMDEKDSEVEIEVKAPCKCGQPDCDCASKEMSSEEPESDTVSKLKALLNK